MQSWKNFFAGLAVLGGIIFPAILALCLVAENGAWTESSKVLESVMPGWEQPIIAAFGAAANFVSPYLLLTGFSFLFCLAIGPQNFSRRARILWNALWVFFVLNITLFLAGIANPLEMTFWPGLANFAAAVIEQAQKIFSFNVYVGWAAGIAFIYSLTIYVKDLASAFINFSVGFLDRRIKPVLVDELKTALGVRLINAPANLVPITPSLLGLMIFIFAIGALPLFLAPRLHDYSVTSVMNILGAAIMTYGFVQIFGVFFIFLTGLVYYLVKMIFGRPQPPPNIPVFK
jgi:hypothetical protein